MCLARPVAPMNNLRARSLGLAFFSGEGEEERRGEGHVGGEIGRWPWTSRVVTWAFDQTHLWETLASKATTTKDTLSRGQ